MRQRGKDKIVSAAGDWTGECFDAGWNSCNFGQEGTRASPGVSPLEKV